MPNDAVGSGLLNSLEIPAYGGISPQLLESFHCLINKFLCVGDKQNPPTASFGI